MQRKVSNKPKSTETFGRSEIACAIDRVRRWREPYYLLLNGTLSTR